MRMTAPQVHAMGLIDDVIAEPRAGLTTEDEGRFANAVGGYIQNALDGLAEKTVEQLLDERYRKLRAFGQEYIIKNKSGK
jgi:acetyl-CoA carboxylase carboxyl transferase subunit alpha